MARTILKIGREDLRAICNEVEKVFGRSITNKVDVSELRENLVLSNPRNVLGENTIRRVFGLIPSAHAPSLETLNSLARYCNYGDWQTFATTTNDRDQKLLDHLLVQHRLETILNQELILKVTDQFGHSPSYYKWCQMVYPTLSVELKMALIKASLSNKSSNLLEFTDLTYPMYYWVQTVGYDVLYGLSDTDPLLTEIIKESNVLKLILSFCVCLDFRRHRYDDLMESNKSIFITDEERLFYFSILLLRKHLRNDSQERAELYDEMMSIPILFPLDCHIMPFSRRRALTIVFGRGFSIEDLTREWFAFHRDASTHESSVFYILQVGRVLCYEKYYEEAAELIELYLKNYKGYVGYWSAITRNRVMIYYATCLEALGKHKKALQVFDNINPLLFDNFQYDIDKRDFTAIKDILGK
jgi:hypothetical protein